ncbi:MAG: FAD-binding protein, partial [Cohaesibacteraceae bacterium]
TGQPGAKLGAVYRAGFPHNLTVPAGWCADVGLGGHALGGGIGYLARAHGLLCDHLAALTLVDAEGHIHHVNAQSDSDLLWASRGGGGGLGAVTR